MSGPGATSPATSGTSLKERVERLKSDLWEPAVQISDYQDLPFAILRYDPNEEFSLREELEVLDRALYKRGRFLRQFSLADLLWESIEIHGLAEPLFDAEREQGLEVVQKTIHNLLTDECYTTLVDLLKERLNGLDPLNEVAFLTRAGSLFRLYRTSALLENLKGVMVPTVLCYPGTLHGAKALSFMGEDEADTNYRPRIY